MHAELLSHHGVGDIYSTAWDAGGDAQVGNVVLLTTEIIFHKNPHSFVIFTFLPVQVLRDVLIRIVAELVLPVAGDGDQDVPGEEASDALTK